MKLVNGGGESAVSEATSRSAGSVTTMQLRQAAGFELHRITSASGVLISALPLGQIYCIEHHGIQINQIRSSPVAGGIGRCYLRILSDTGIELVEIIGPKAHSTFAPTKDHFTWSGNWKGLYYTVHCLLHPRDATWFFRVEVENRGGAPIKCDAILLQDVGLASPAQVRNNELFTSQYLDHAVHSDPACGFVVMTRQNLKQGDMFPWLMQGCLEGCRGFTTDGFDFFGPGFKETDIPAALRREVIGGSVRQYETAYIAVQSEAVSLASSAKTAWTFFAAYVDHPDQSSAADLQRLARVRAAWEDCRDTPGESLPALPHRKSIFSTASLFQSDDLTGEQIRQMFPGEHRHVELVGGTLHSFFLGDDTRHVVLKRKEVLSERPHGHIMRSGEGFTPADHLMSATFYAAGVFGSQLALGHTTVGKLLSGARDPLNIIRSSGLRIFVRTGDSATWQLLAVPSAFEMSPGECAWHYVCGDCRITVTCSTSDHDPALRYDLQATGRTCEFLISGEICMGPNEYDETPELQIDSSRQRITIRPAAGSFLASKEPGIAFCVVSSTHASIASVAGDQLLFEDGISHSLPYFTIKTHATAHFGFAVVGTRHAAVDFEALCHRFETPSAGSVATSWRRVTSGLRLKSSAPDAPAMQDALQWFSRDAMIHLSTPRGLEQANGGAWGVRDVCQGPVEFLLSYGHDHVVATILHTLFSHQYANRHDWPQWFSFPPFEEIQSPHCHGDVLIWPLKALCDYLEDSNDRSILDERLPYTDEKTFHRTEHRETILQHVDRLLARIGQSFLPGTSLPAYGEGDWDDSLQPAEAKLRDHMVSSWTTGLLYQTLSRWGQILAHFELRERAQRALDLAQRVRADFQRHLVRDGVVAGFAIFEGSHPVNFLLHPSDKKTGLCYRLIPMTRGIISQIFTPEQARAHLSLIQKHLLFPDGARLMDRPTEYRGGLETVFRRSESASFFGREIGLQYVHAHLRYAESLATLGRGDELLKALLTVNPIAVTQVVPNANARQRNCFFSSSDADFATRYEASQSYDQLTKGKVPVNGGWRVYSSGPGIYTNLVVRRMFGIRRCLDWVEFDPVLPANWDGSEMSMGEASHRVTYRFCRSPQPCLRINGHEVEHAAGVPNPYRGGGIRLSRREFQRHLSDSVNVVEIDWSPEG